MVSGAWLVARVSSTQLHTRALLENSEKLTGTGGRSSLTSPDGSSSLPADSRSIPTPADDAVTS